MRLFESFMTKNPVYGAGEKMDPKGIAIYTVGCPQPSAKVLIHNWNRENFENGCPHAIIDAKTGDVYQTLPYDIKGVHSRNSADEDRIGVILCEPSSIKYKNKYEIVDLNPTMTEQFIETAYGSAVKFCISLCKQFGFDPMSAIGSLPASASRNRFPDVLWSIGGSGRTMKEFKDAVQFGLLEKQAPVVTILIEHSNLRLRTGPGKEYESVGYAPVGEHLLSERQNGNGSNNGWGKLADGSGWVSLDYVTQL